MKIIPVVDIKNAQVVRAVRGERAHYQPVKSKLCASSNPRDVVSTFIQTTESETIYIADLDAIEDGGNNNSTIYDLMKTFPRVSFWVDAGFRSKAQIEHWKNMPRLIPVIGTESHSCLSSIRPLLKDNAILSLDFKNNQLYGPVDILQATTLWPQKVIVMMLDIIGSDKGPDLALLNQIKDQIKKTTSQTHVFAAGGVRGDDDIKKLSQRGITGVLIASALHDQTLSPASLASRFLA